MLHQSSPFFLKLKGHSFVFLHQILLKLYFADNEDVKLALMNSFQKIH